MMRTIALAAADDHPWKRRTNKTPSKHPHQTTHRKQTVSQFLYDRYLPASSSRAWVPHLIRLVSFAALQLPVFTYLITQFQALGLEVRTFTRGAISPYASVLASAGILLVSDLLGGMRSVAYTDVVQGAVLFVGSLIFLIIQRTELGGLPLAAQYWRNPQMLERPTVAAMQLVPSQAGIVSYFDFVFKTTIAATMFPHLNQRLFAGRSASVVRTGMSATAFSFFLVQLASMVTGWVAIAALSGGAVAKGESAFSKMLLLVSGHGPGQALLAALLLAAAVCAMMSTADSALLAFSLMWVQDLYKPYLRPRASPREQLLFARVMAVAALAVGVGLGLKTIQTGTPNLSALFSLQNVTP